MEQELIAKYEFQGYTSKLVTYQGPFHKIRPFLKWLMIAYLIVFLVIDTWILHEMTMNEFIRMSIVPFGLLAWLIKTRNRRDDDSEPVELYFYKDYFMLVKPQTLVRYGNKEIPQRDACSMKYKDVTKLRHDLGLHLVTITGYLHAEFFDYPGDEIPGKPPRKAKDVKEAAAFWYTDYMDMKLNEEIKQMFVKLVGMDFYEFGTDYRAEKLKRLEEQKKLK